MAGSDTSDIVERLLELDADAGHLTTWEQEFLEDVGDRAAAGQRLTDGQREKLAQIWDEKGGW